MKRTQIPQSRRTILNVGTVPTALGSILFFSAFILLPLGAVDRMSSPMSFVLIPFAGMMMIIAG